MRAKDDLIVLGIETSCDDTAAAVVRGNGEILSQVVSSQFTCHMLIFQVCTMSRQIC